MAKRDGRDPKLAIGAIFKNEAPYILEWLAFHRAVGIERFFIADNASDDGSSELLAALDRAGLIRHIPFAGPAGRPPQLPAYAEILRRHACDADWIAFIDADEFLVPEAPGATVQEALGHLWTRPDVGAIAASWASFGSGGEIAARTEPVVERFRRHAGAEHPINRHYKSIVRTTACRGVASTPHAFRLRTGFRTVHPDGSEVAHVNPRLPGLARSVHWSPLRLNHYVVKSREEFERKRRRGRATKLGAPRGAAFFAAHDLNAVETPMDPGLVAAARSGNALLLRELAVARQTATEPALRPRGAPILLPAAPGSGRSQGRIDRIAAIGQVVELAGWALAPDGSRMASFFLRDAAGGVIDPLETVRRPRPDVAARFPGAHPTSGFALTFPFEMIPAGGLRLRAIAPEGGVLDLALPALAGAARASAVRVPDAPLMPPEGAAAFGEAVARARSYLEYGSGGSTVLAVRSGVPGIVSIESDPIWHAAVRHRVADRLLPGRHHLQHVDIGPTSRFGYPASEAPWRRFAQYPLDPWRLCRDRGLDPDLVLIDGRFRVACFLATLINASPGCRIFFDDYQGRDAYHGVSAFVQPIRLIDRIAEFNVPEERSIEALWPALIEAVGDPL